MLENLFMGIGIAFTWDNLMYSFIGVFVGNLIGVLPGIGSLAAISMALPITYSIDPAGALMMLAGLYYGTTYGGATTSILLNLPGTPGHAVVCLEGHELTKQGRAGPALLMSMIASFIGATIGILLIMVSGPVLVKIAIGFGPTEYFALMLLGLMAAATVSTGTPLKSIAMVVMGLSLGVIGVDINTGVTRFTFSTPELTDGISMIAIAMGLFGITDVIASTNRFNDERSRQIRTVDMRSMKLKTGELRTSLTAMIRGSAIGSFFGVLPGTGGTVASFMSYAVEKKVSKNKSNFGKGAIEGVASPEAANSSTALTSFIPTLSLGIPGDVVMALMLGAMMIHNIQPGPTLITSHPDIFWGLVASFWVGNALLLILNIPLIGLWVRLLSIPYRIIYPAILLFICIGVYSANNSLYDVGVCLVIGIIGYVLTQLDFQPAPLLLGFVLGPLVEENFRRTLILSHGDMTVFITKPFSALCLSLVVLLFVWVGIRYIRRVKA